ncbi:MAG: 7-cyano-7-deazaguanine synthase [Nanoarchaeota archaeon]
MEKAIVLFSGGLDSILVAKILKEQSLDVVALNFKLPFVKDNSLDIGKKFLEKEKITLKIFDCNKGKLLSEYLEIIKKPAHGRGNGLNPCVDCKIFILNKAKEYSIKNKISIIATGDVLDERPMSQNIQALKLIDKKVGFEILRPLSARLLNETSAEKNNLLNRDKFFAIQGKKREIQMHLAKKFSIHEYPQPGGGCLLCEKINSRIIKLLLSKNLINSQTLKLIRAGRHFYYENCWFVVGRDEKENSTLEKFENTLKSGKSKPAVYFYTESGESFARVLQDAYKNKDYNGVEKFKI